MHDTVLTIALCGAGAALMAAVMHVTWIKVTFTVCAAAIGIGLRPKHWLRFVALILFVAGTLGLVMIGSDYLRDATYETPLRHSNEEYAPRAFIYVMFLAAYLSWHFRSGRRSQE